MVAVILIVTSSQMPNVKQILHALSAQASQHGVLVCVFEGNDQDYSTLLEISKDQDIDVIRAEHSFTGFSAGANRDIGIKHCHELYGQCDFIFIDGDCIASSNLIQEHVSMLSKPFPIVSCGFRYNRTKPVNNQYRIIPDRRLQNFYTKHRTFVAGMNALAYMPYEIVNHDVVWTCNLGINATALQIIRDNTLHQSKDKSRYFCDVFDGKWGGEDTFAGIAAFRAGCVITTLDPNKSWVEHIYHDTKHQGNDNLRRVLYLDALMQQHIASTCSMNISDELFECLGSRFPSNMGLTSRDPHSEFLAKHMHGIPQEIVHLFTARVIKFSRGTEITIRVDPVMLERYWFAIRSRVININTYLEANPCNL